MQISIVMKKMVRKASTANPPSIYDIGEVLVRIRCKTHRLTKKNGVLKGVKEESEENSLQPQVVFSQRHQQCHQRRRTQATEVKPMKLLDPLHT